MALPTMVAVTMTVPIMDVIMDTVVDTGVATEAAGGKIYDTGKCGVWI